MTHVGHWLCLMLVSTAAPRLEAAALSVLPTPVSVVAKTGSFRFDHNALHVFADPSDPGAVEAMRRLSLLSSRLGSTLVADATHRTGTISFVRDTAVTGEEAYRLDVTPRGITVRGSGDAGLFYGAETVWQLIASAPNQTIAAVEIEDRPGFAWRGVMLDSVRHFQPVGYIEQLLDRMALQKLNMFQWHLTDDQGWRLPVDGYPKLTAIGGWRTPAGASGRDPKTGEAIRYGGFYTHDEIRAVVAYAAARHITIVPEIEMPGHATAAIAAYPELASTKTPPDAPSSDWGVLPNLFSTSGRSFALIHAVLDQVMALFPGRYIHIGGDEAPKGQWRTDPQEQSLIKRLGFTGEEQLQGWFTGQIGAYLENHGRRLVGWDEVLEGGIPADATIMSWHGIDGALLAARSGHDAVLAPAPTFYLDNRQSDSPDEPPGRGEIIDWKHLYAFDVLPQTLSAQDRAHILGVQANLWTEHVRTLADADRMLWPRAAILAELGWSAQTPRNWTDFSSRLVAEMAQWRSLGWSYDETPLEPEASLKGAYVWLTTPSGIGTLRYTIDGSQPGPMSSIADQPVPLADAGNINVQAFFGGTALGSVQHFHFTAASSATLSATAMRFCDYEDPVRLEDDDAGLDGRRPIHWVDVMKPCWIWPAAPLNGASRISVKVGQVPYNFAFGNDPVPAKFAAPRTAAGELEVRRDDCDGPLIAVVPLAAAVGRPGDSDVAAPLKSPVSGDHDLCMTFTQAQADPLWVLDQVTLAP